MHATTRFGCTAIERLMPPRATGNVREKNKTGTSPTRRHTPLGPNLPLGPPTESRYPEWNGLRRGQKGVCNNRTTKKGGTPCKH